MSAARAPTRILSMYSRTRLALRAFEAHPFGRDPSAVAPAKPDIPRLVKHAGSAFSVYTLFVVGFFGWPFAAEEVCRST